MNKENFSRPPIFYLIVNNKVDEFEKELDQLDDINIQDKIGLSLLHFAAQYHQIQVAKRLIEKGINMELQDKYGNTALWKAVFNARGQYDLVQLLIENGANPETKNKAGRNSIDLAGIIGSKELMEILKKSNTPNNL